ncbi:hypothetical protein ABPG74_001396, partial [Tetrahymena malaccensis]
QNKETKQQYRASTQTQQTLNLLSSPINTDIKLINLNSERNETNFQTKYFSKQKLQSSPLKQRKSTLKFKNESNPKLQIESIVLEENNDDENEEQEAGQNTQKNHNEFTSNIQLKQTQKQKEELKNDQLEAQNYEKILFFKKEYFKIYSFNFLLLKNYAYSFNFDNFCTV